MEEPINTYTLLNMFSDGGWWMYPLLLCSLFALGVILAKAYMLWAAYRESAGVMEQVETLARAGKVDAAIQLCEETPGPVAAILLTGLRRLRRRDLSTNDVQQAIKTAGTVELGFLERGLPVLATIANVAPLLGFLGTVAGMIIAFGEIARAGQVEASLVAGGIKIALITTATGLIIAIPVNIAYNFFVSRIDMLIMQMEQGSAEILNIIWDAGGGAPSLAGVAAATPGRPIQPATQSIEQTDTPDPGSRDRDAR
ncbi:MAG TPA: MotA/TolQ/ExbB proton channel family protein [Longimicrobiales bacterium]|nr:MotA/TolQ/ExbB proton channel family protein [Longimicrobiales bacterium]